MKITESQLRGIIRREINEAYYGRKSYGSRSYGDYGSGGEMDYYTEKYGEDYITDVLDDLGGDYGAALAQLQDMERDEEEQASRRAAAKPKVAAPPAPPSKVISREEYSEIYKKIWAGAEEKAGKRLDIFRDFSTYVDYFRGGYHDDPEYKAADKQTKMAWEAMAADAVKSIYRQTD